MSLFSSAFDANLPASSSSTSLASGGGAGAKNKRKRPSLTNSGKDDQLRATQVNLARLMDKVDRGEFTDKAASGREAMGSMGKGQARGEARGEGVNKKAKRDEPRQSAFGKGKGKGGQEGKWDKLDKSGKEGKFDKKKNDKPAPTKSPKEKKAQAPAPAKPQPKHQPGKRSKLAPAELEIPSAPAPKAAAADDGLTDMQRKMQSKLEGARFRWINEQLYSTASTDAVAMMDTDPKVFADYHDTHRQLTAAWPQPPLEHIIALLRPLPKGTIIADLGCGDAGLARALVPAGKVVLSFDLVGDIGGTRSVGSEGWVVPCDFLAGVPLPGRAGGDDDDGKKRRGGKRDPAASEVVDAVVCCLSLMGTNWVGGVYEAARILKQGGAFHVAEVTSRFVSTEAFVDAVTSFGLVLEAQEEPSTHFTLFKFTKKTATPVGPVRGQDGWEARVEEGEGILRPCVYKRR